MFKAPVVERGKIQHRARRQQIADMSGLRFNKITPTDLDGFIDFDNRLFIFMEGKFIGTPVLFGQELSIDRLCDASHNPPHRYAFAIIADHCHPVTEDIDFAHMTVRTIRQNGKWAAPMQRDLTVRAAVDRMLAFVENKQRRPLFYKGAA